ncbi:MAG TPA: ABC transporter permease [Actinomycetota bacterium]|nr:ABC transporter permease [Actinomycetota bacterium]
MAEPEAPRPSGGVEVLPQDEARAAGPVLAPEPTGFVQIVTGRGFRETVLVPALALLTALLAGALLIIFTEPDALAAWGRFLRDPLGALSASARAVADAYRALLTGAFGDPARYAEAFRSGDAREVARAFNPLSETLVVATPLVLTGLAVALPFRAGLFNIGGEGQLTAGAVAAAAAGFSLPGLPGPLRLGAVVLAGALGGAAWGAVPGFLKARTGAHEVITTIMLNFVASFLALYLLSTEFYRRPDRTDPISKPVEAAYPHLFGPSLRLHAGLLVALALAAGVAWLLNRTTVGFEFQAVGAGPDAARAAGMDPARTYLAVMALAGGLAGLAGANQLLSVTPSLTPGFSSGFGFDGITLALLGRARPAGVVLAALLFGALRAGSRSMQAATQTPVDIIVVIQALVVVFIAAPAIVRGIYRIRTRPAPGPEGAGPASRPAEDAP